MSAETLPVATAGQVRAYAWRLVLRHPRALARVLVLHALAAVAGLVGPWLLGDLVQGIADGHADVDGVALAIAGFVIAQGVLMYHAHYAAARLGERVLAELREEFVGRALRLPLSTVERAGTGDLVSRASRDVGGLSDVVRFALPETMTSLVLVVFTVGALVLVGPLLMLPCLLGVPLIWAVTRWYLPRARTAYVRENQAWAHLAGGLAETVAAARTVEALGLQRQRHRRVDADIAASWERERRTLRLRLVYYPVIELSFTVQTAAALLIGGLYHLHGWASPAQVTAAVLYVRQLADPVDQILSRLDSLQLGGASLARLLGVAHVPPDRIPTAGRPPLDGEPSLAACDVRYAYRADRDVLHGVDLVLRPGERLAVVGPSGAGKSTLGLLLAGVHTPRTGTVTVGTDGLRVPLVELPLEELRGQVALVTQEHHVFYGTVRDNLLLARPDATDEQARAALEAVEWDGPGLDAVVGSGGRALSPAQVQQLALARLVLADPHTLVLDEATSLLHPRAARRLERSLAAVLEGRTVVAIAHRLHTAHDADRVAVMEDGRISELGSHQELIKAGGRYAALWRSWHGT
ncbi:ABC transporter ATP-binding protein [Thermomonospora curvata]|uniref:ABC transporter related protein n=1 Tax=Thermomonospora curvata (strain ATCC 19995 / DSM 43183 / JCM 3096 / KCTC 9072 / NBRC 15933 / NCIMB 10081 / Henssen B9) TaxID=471852 RepID=D1A8L8_THECD|nr:ABC transporter ATP-binding protein [Thermomonospora curvata]ACY96713.1 ABC transporter related protein [Thermomonospora curvata DSM 43183]